EILSERAASIIADQILLKPDSVLGLATGSTPIGTYRQLVNKHKSGILDFSKITTFNLDEYFPILKDNDQSYVYFMHENLFKHVNINPKNIHIPNGEASDPKVECAFYEEKMQSYEIDLQILGLGANGHIGFNEPSEHFQLKTHHVELDSETINSNARFFNSIDDVPKSALTMGIGAIMNAKHVLLVINGAHKAEIAAKILFDDITPKIPGSILQLHPNVTVILDEAASEIVEKRLKELK
ncbi:MAG: glucosamine-6-phosphate deaminase, partial [Defluviitaleaceae bacterium]|nr:glucosamine-6-phosphate deaminase [Defluviitaleaceae bacterium]